MRERESFLKSVHEFNPDFSNTVHSLKHSKMFGVSNVESNRGLGMSHPAGASSHGSLHFISKGGLGGQSPVKEDYREYNESRDALTGSQL